MHIVYGEEMSVFSSTNHWDHINNHTTRHPDQSAFMPDVTAFTPIWGQEQAPPPIVSYPDLMAAGFQCAADLAIWPRSQMGGLVSQRMSSPRGGLPAPHSATTSTTTTKKTRRRVASLAQRRAANIRERRRMFNLNEAFDKLRRKVPTFAYEKRLSRIETLRLAITYISFMTELMSGGNPDGRNNDIYSPPAIVVAAATNGETHHHHHHHNNMNNGHHHNHINNTNNNGHHHHHHNHHHHLHHDHQSISREFISSFSQSG